VKEESFFSGRNPAPMITSDKGKFVSVKVSDKEWVFPTSGVIFFWDI
jgi:alanine racemase